MKSNEILKKYYGYESFREGQELLINEILNGKDVLGIMPTGAGKSLCFQVPALMLEGITIIVSPLISLMKDQVNTLTQMGIKSAFINSSLSQSQIQTALHNFKKGFYKLIYVSPERLLSDDFLSIANIVKISMLAIDEAHCISQWGQDFRPSYSKIPEFINSLQKRPIVSVFTATATPRVKEDIINLLELQDPYVLVTGFDRKNLYFDVQKPKNKLVTLLSILENKKDRFGIIYCSTRSAVEEVCEILNRKGYNAARYHAGLTERERHENQENFLYDRVQIMVATNAFGMGIDKSNVSFVIHFNMPMDIESYYQEAGRAGRDGGAAECILLYSGMDVQTNLWLIENGRDNEYNDKETEKILKEHNRAKLREMTFYCSLSECLRRYVLRYFGENPSNFCGNCSNCTSNFVNVDITIEAQKILSCVARTNERYGANVTIDVLRGSKSEKIVRLGLDKLSTYNISEKSSQQLHDIINYLILNEYLVKTNDKYPVLKLGKHAKRLLSGAITLQMKLLKEVKESERKNQAITDTVDKNLMSSLKQVRLNTANEQKVPAFVIFSDRTLTDMCKKLPKTNEELLNVTGVGQVKLERYGKEFLDAIAEFCI